MIYLIWFLPHFVLVFLFCGLNHSYPDTTRRPVSSTFYNKQGEFLSFYYISEEMPDPGSSLREKLARSLLAQIQKEQIKKGWDDWTLLFFFFPPWCVLCARLHSHFDAISVIRAIRCALGSSHKRIWCTTRGLEWALHLFSEEGVGLSFWSISLV